jgi:hypothetical protein
MPFQNMDHAEDGSVEYISNTFNSPKPPALNAVLEVESLADVPGECLSLPEWEKVTGQWESLAHDEPQYDPVRSDTSGQLDIKEDGTANVCFPLGEWEYPIFQGTVKFENGYMNIVKDETPEEVQSENWSEIIDISIVTQPLVLKSVNSAPISLVSGDLVCSRSDNEHRTEFTHYAAFRKQ